MATYEVNDDISPFRRVVYIEADYGSETFSGSGIIIGENDILTAAHVIYDKKLGGLPDACRIYPSYDPNSSSNTYYNAEWYNTFDWDENGDELVTAGDGVPGTLLELEKDIGLISLGTDIGSTYGWMGLKFDFDSGTASKLGHPGQYNYRLMYDEGIVYKNSIDNFFSWNTSDIEVNSGDSGGPVYVYSGASLEYQVIGVVSTNSWACALNAHSDWLLEERELNNYLYDKSFATITSANSVNEGSSISFTFKTHKKEENTQYTYTLSGVSSSDFSSGALSGITTIDENGEATFSIGISTDQKTEGTENFTLSIGEKTKSISINDTSTDEIKPLITGPSGSAGAENSKKTINENTTTVHTFTANEAVTWSINGGNDPTFFSINSTTGLLTFNNAPDYENHLDSNSNGIYSIYVKATDLAGNSSNQWIETTIADVNEAPTDLRLISTSFNENIAASTIVSAIGSTDADTSDLRTYSLISGNGDTDNSLFTIYKGVAITYLKINSSPDYETKSSYNIRLQVTDSGGETYAKAFTLSVNDLNETPTALTLSSSSFNENIAAASTVATLSTTDDDTSDTHTYSLVTGTDDTDNSSFTIDGSSLKIKASPDYETKSSYKIRLQTTDSGGETYAEAFTLSVNALEEGDTEKPIIYGVNNDVLYSTTSGTFASSTSIDIQEGTNQEIYRFIANEEVTWSISQLFDNNDYQHFSIDPITGSLSINGNLDYENPQAGGDNNLYIMSINSTDTNENVNNSNWFRVVITDVEDESNTSSTSATSTELQQLYIGYFGRPCDPNGLDYWLGQKVTKKAFAANMYLQPEFNSVNGNLSTTAQVNQIYLNLFNRNGDTAGLTYWSSQIDSGNLELASIANDLTWAALNNDGSEVDKKTLTHKTNAAIQYTYEIRKSTSDILAYQPASTSPWITGNNLTEAKTFINEIGYSTVATLSEIQNSITKFSSTSSNLQLSPVSNPSNSIDVITGLTLDNLSDYSLDNLRQPDTTNINSSNISHAPNINYKLNYVELSNHLTNQEYIDNLYGDILNRAADSNGHNYWVGQLNSGAETRYEVLLGFAESAENKGLFTEMTGFG
ncbi:DUF4214 domain-containing protein [Prochlorococcus sp. MIT 0801]|uniref:DUF4214 domain-containing protein n=1 Tax=Prochlorococcus sp. MIT 0801 TaxID=1501269 RepID=UPI0004F92726|nr:DUF4214 domain-containing protein [Prochlorococcus sp. MIT 0801]AIQ96576.1 hypothetical protein EW15_0484 [Prochlorococcus sp. MIT 0801]